MERYSNALIFNQWTLEVAKEWCANSRSPGLTEHGRGSGRRASRVAGPLDVVWSEKWRAKLLLLSRAKSANRAPTRLTLNIPRQLHLPCDSRVMEATNPMLDWLFSLRIVNLISGVRGAKFPVWQSNFPVTCPGYMPSSWLSTCLLSPSIDPLSRPLSRPGPITRLQHLIYRTYHRSDINSSMPHDSLTKRPFSAKGATPANYGAKHPKILVHSLPMQQLYLNGF
jgi:hypothetical protein